MTSWMALALLVAAAFALLLRLGISRSLAAFPGAALLLGAAGYAVQGRPGLEGAPASPAPATIEVDPGISMLRTAMFGRFTVSESYFMAGDALTRAGSPHSAVTLYLGAVNAQSQNFALWTGLGSAFAQNDGTVSPAARFAFQRAMKIAPEHSGPPFFFGLALVRAGELREARIWWHRAYRLTPTRLSYRSDLGHRLAMLERVLAGEAGQAGR